MQDIWHITHGCHRRRFQLRFARDRRLWIRWLYAARARFGLCVLDYRVTSNHVHLLARDRGFGEIPQSLQLIAGCTGQAVSMPVKLAYAAWLRAPTVAVSDDGEWGTPDTLTMRVKLGENELEATGASEVVVGQFSACNDSLRHRKQ